MVSVSKRAPGDDSPPVQVKNKALNIYFDVALNLNTVLPKPYFIPLDLNLAATLNEFRV